MTLTQSLKIDDDGLSSSSFGILLCGGLISRRITAVGKLLTLHRLGRDCLSLTFIFTIFIERLRMSDISIYQFP